MVIETGWAPGCTARALAELTVIALPKASLRSAAGYVGYRAAVKGNIVNLSFRFLSPG